MSTPGRRVLPFGPEHPVSPEALVAFWVGEGVLGPEDARRRVPEVLVVAVDDEDRPLGVASAYLARQPQLRMDAWHMRAFVAAALRRSALGLELVFAGRDLLERRFLSGEDTRGAAAVGEIEEPQLRAVDTADWMPLNMPFVGMTPRGNPLRVHYFPGALAPPPPR